MMAGALQAMQEAGLDPSKYWLGSSNGKEKSWAWVKNGTTTMDVNETPTLEADIAYQQIKAYFAGKPYKKAVFVSAHSVHQERYQRRQAGSLLP